MGFCLQEREKEFEESMENEGEPVVRNNVKLEIHETRNYKASQT